MASIYNLLENKEATPLSIVNSKVTLLEHITEKPSDGNIISTFEVANIKKSLQKLKIKSKFFEKKKKMDF